MDTSFKRSLAAGALAAAVLFGSAQGAAAQVTGGAEDPPAVAYRKSVMQALVAQVQSLRALLTGEVSRPGDMQRHAAAVRNNALMMHGLFPENSTGRTSAATGEIWTRQEEFRTGIQAMQAAAKALDDAAQAGERALALSYLQVFTGTCGSCHASFKLPAPRIDATLVD